MKPPLTTEARKTPITDAFVAKSEAAYYPPHPYPIFDFARELERDNQVLTEALEEALGCAEMDWLSTKCEFAKEEPRSYHTHVLASKQERIDRYKTALGISTIPTP